MKNLIVILTFTFLSSVNVFSTSTIPTNGDDRLVLDNSEVSFTWESSSSVVTNTTYDDVEQFFTIETENTINFLQVVNEAGDVDYLLPIGAKVLNLSLSDFEKGTYRINLMVEGESKYVTTELIKKS